MSTRREQPPWTLPPAHDGVPLPPLRIFNSLTRKKEPFVPLDPAGKTVTWYCCGPTVYDAGHLGHARNYVTTDVLRRIMRDYFGFEVRFVQNVTDVDDKIILRARQNHLLEEFTSSNPTLTPDVLKTVTSAWSSYLSKITTDTPTPTDFPAWAATNHPALTALIASPAKDTVLDEATTKLKMHLTTLLTAATALTTPPSETAAFYTSCTPVLLPYLDKLHADREYETDVFTKLSTYWERHFETDMRTLNVLPPTTVTRVSEFIPENVAFVEKLVDRGFAYPTADGSVYFDIAAYEAAGHHYAKLQPWNRGDEALIADGEGALTSAKAGTDTLAQVGGGVQAAKKSAQDFALWKASKKGEPSWESPWGRGRPGWHIECSVMCSEVLGQQVDIHSGGVDLAFPHHDNEIAQSEAYWDGCEGGHKTLDGRHQWINYFLHMGHLNIHGSKMSKSLKNFVSIRDALGRGGWTARGLRVVFLMGGWKEGIEVREGVLAEAKNWEASVTKFFVNVKALVAEEEARESAGEKIPQLFGGREHAIFKELDKTRAAVHAALCDNFNTADAMKALTDLITETNKYMSATPALAAPKEVARYITRIVTVFGLDPLSTPSGEDRIGWSDPTSTTSTTSSAETPEEALLPYLRALSTFRDAVRKLAIANPDAPTSAPLLTLSDNLRDYDLAALGVSLDDREFANGKPALIKFAPAAELVAAREEKVRRAEEKERRKEEARVKREEEERRRSEAASVSHLVMYRTEEWGEWDEEGMPVRDREGVEVTKSRGKVLRKGWERQKKAHEAWLKTKGA
ncbi:uncharacterized protein LAJ45_02294 [Morchella importuna]|nr:uncharacterized protein LAJ45_02294 [Morchella importuna]KAH8153481.1 hypothetical protein LAJ45_02294 [Morchella importuna]